MVPLSMIEMTTEEWMAEGEKLFGPDQMKWKFVCPVCGFVQTPQAYKDAGAPTNAVAFSCVGRWTGAKEWNKGPGPCNYAGGGLFKLNPVLVDQEHQLFDFERKTAQAT